MWGAPRLYSWHSILYQLEINDLNNAPCVMQSCLLIETYLSPITWFSANRMSLNLARTNFMVIKPWQKKKSFEFHKRAAYFSRF